MSTVQSIFDERAKISQTQLQFPTQHTTLS